jgi:hypothetical protein
MALRFLFPALIVVGLVSTAGNNPPPSRQLSEDFKNYWYKGKAEVCSYDLQQSRYGEMHPGDMVLIFVTEDFSASEHVKTDHPKHADDVVKVLKMNAVRKFNTGIYPYSVMQSVFTPVNGSSTLKSTASVQEWCGQIFTAIDLQKNNKYRVDSYSYFEGEATKKTEIPGGLLEDELMNLIRIDPTTLPLGNVNMVPNSAYCRLMHKPNTPEKATLTLTTASDGLQTYQIYYPDLDRQVNITFEQQPPYQITKLEETYVGLGGKKLTTTATLKKTLYIDYWKHNKNIDSYLRDSLQLHY